MNRFFYKFEVLHDFNLGNSDNLPQQIMNYLFDFLILN